MIKIFWWIILLVAATVAQVFYKLGVRDIAPTPTGTLAILKAYMGNMYIWIGLGLGIISFAAWLRILNFSRLSSAFNVSALMYPLIALLSLYFLQEPLHPRFWLGTILIASGVCLSI